MVFRKVSFLFIRAWYKCFVVPVIPPKFSSEVFAMVCKPALSPKYALPASEQPSSDLSFANGGSKVPRPKDSVVAP